MWLLQTTNHNLNLNQTAVHSVNDFLEVNFTIFLTHSNAQKWTPAPGDLSVKSGNMLTHLQVKGDFLCC